MRTAAAALVLALVAAGCVTRRVEPERPTVPVASPAGDSSDADPIEAMAAMDLRIEGDRVRVVVPARLGDRIGPETRQVNPPFERDLGRIRVAAREEWPSVEVAGEDFSIIAEGGVRTTRTEGGVSVTEGPFQTVILRNGRLLRR